MYISKASLQDGVMRWSAVNSDTDWDLYGERMSLELYHKMLGYIRDKVLPPAQFRNMVTSEYWKGGMPYVSLSHYPDLNGRAVPGKPTELFIDGNQLKAKGILFDTKLGRAVWKSLKEDEINTKSNTDNDRIRISIAFLDLAHKHGENGEVFVRDSILKPCPGCIRKEGNKIYLDGYLVHLALTRVPVNPRSIMEVEKSMAKGKIQTRKEDALSIVQDADLVEEIAEAALETKSDILVEMSEAEVEASKTKDSPKEDEMAHGDDKEDMAEEMDDKKKKKVEKALTAEDVLEIVKSLLPVPTTEEVSLVSEKSALDLATDSLYTSVSSAINLQGATLEQRLESINPALQELGQSISVLVRESMGQPAPAPVSNDSGLVLEAISELAGTLKSLATEVATMKAQYATATIPSASLNRVPVPRSIQPAQLVTKSQPAEQVANPNSVANITRRSVSSKLELVNR